MDVCKDLAIQRAYVYLCMAVLRQMMNMHFPKQKLNQNSNPNESENLPHFRYAKSHQNPTTFGFCHIPNRLNCGDIQHTEFLCFTHCQWV